MLSLMSSQITIDAGREDSGRQTMSLVRTIQIKVFSGLQIKVPRVVRPLPWRWE
jgi:hypothetical protein